MNEITAHAFNWVDYVVISLILISTLISLMRGFLSEAISLLTWIIAVIVAFNYSSSISVFFAHFIHKASLRIIASFVALFVLTLLLGGIINYFFAVFVQRSGLSGTNRILGMAFGFARGIFLVAIFILFANFTSFVKEPWWTHSQLIPHFQDLTQWLQNVLPVEFNNMSHYLANLKLGKT